MKRNRLSIQLTLAILGATISAAGDFLPQPTELTREAGSCAFAAGARIFFETRDVPRPVERSLRPLAEVFAGELEMLTGIRPSLTEKTGTAAPGPGDISLEFAALAGVFADSEESEDQSYTLTVTDHVTVSGQYFKGIAYGTATLLQALEEDAGSFSFPRMAVRDTPASVYRAVMIDLARQPSSLGTVREVIRLARLCKLRYVHLHLTDDQNFTFPFAPVTDNVANNFTYGRAALEELASYADARGVTLIPELDLPGHSSKLRASGFLDPSENDADVASPANYARIQAIIDDMLLVFPNSPYFHIGGDESGAGRALVPFLEAMNGHLRGKPAGLKKRLLVWEGFHGAPVDALPPTGADRVIVLAWESRYNTPWNLLENGYTVINASWKPLYIVGSGATNRQPHSAQRMWSAETLHAWDKYLFVHWQPGTPVFEDQGPSDPIRDDGIWSAASINRQRQVIGGQMLSWEQNEKTIVRDLLPRLPVMADRLWHPDSGESFEAFSHRLAAVRERILTIVRPVEILPLSTTPDSPVSLDYRQYSGRDVTVTLRNRTRIDGTIRYEIGGFSNSRSSIDFSLVPETTAASAAYTAPFERTGGFGIRAQLYRADDGTPVEGHDWQHYCNWDNRVAVTEFDVPRRPLEVVPDFASYSTDRITRKYELPILHGPYQNEKVKGQMFRSVLHVPGTGTFDLSVQTSDGRASVYIDLDKNGAWDANEKLITDSLPNDRAVHTTVELTEGDYPFRVDHASGAIGSVMWLKLDGPGTSGNKDITEFLSLPVVVDAPPTPPRHRSPADGDPSVRPGQSLQWKSEGAESYDVFLWKSGSARPPQPVARDLAIAEFAPAELEPGSTYRWSVVARNSLGAAESTSTKFTVAEKPPVGSLIGWNYVGIGAVSLKTTERAGAPGYEQRHWNNHAGSGQGPGTVPFPLNDAAGAPSGMRVTAWTLSADNSWHHAKTADANQILTNDFTDRQPSICFSGIPYASYSIVVYYGNNEGPSLSTLSVIGSLDDKVSRSVTTGDTALSSAAAVGWVEETGAFSKPSNYTVFAGLNDPQTTIALEGDNNNGISAIQFVDTTPQ